MLESWSVLSLVLATFFLIVIVISIGALGIMMTEDEDVATAYSRAARMMFGLAQYGPKHSTFSTIYCPIVYVTMTILVAALLTEAMSRVG